MITPKKILKRLILIPNLPFILIFIGYIVYKIYKHTGIVEMELKSGEEMLTDELKKYIMERYPKHLQIFIAVFFYIWLYLNFL